MVDAQGCPTLATREAPPPLLLWHVPAAPPLRCRIPEKPIVFFVIADPKDDGGFAFGWMGNDGVEESPTVEEWQPPQVREFVFADEFAWDAVATDLIAYGWVAFEALFPLH